MGDAPEAAAGGDPACGSVRRARKTNPLATRIKRLMQTDEDVGKIAQAAPALIVRQRRALELFLGRLCNGANAVAQQHYANQLSAGHLKAAVAADSTLDFLKDAVSEAPDLPPPPDQPPVRRQRKKEDAAGEGGEAEAAAPKQRKPRARKRKAASDEDDADEDAAAAAERSDPDYSDDTGAGKKRQRKRKAAPRKPRGSKAAAAAVGSQAAGGRRAKPKKNAESDVELSDTGKDAEAGGWHSVADATAAPPETAQQRVGSADQSTAGAAVPPVRAAASGWHAVGPDGGAHAAADQPAAAAAAPAAQQPVGQQASIAVAPDGGVAGAAPARNDDAAAAGLPADLLSIPLTALVPPVEEDDYDAE